MGHDLQRILLYRFLHDRLIVSDVARRTGGKSAAGEVHNPGGVAQTVIRRWKRSSESSRGPGPAQAGLAIRERSVQGRSRLLHIESWDIPVPLSELENYARAGNDFRRNHRLTAWAISAHVGKLSQ
jgi:hypothetical protein